FPTVSPLQPFYNGGGADAFITKLNAAGSALVYSTYLGGGTGIDIATGIKVDPTGNVFVSGFTTSTIDFPVVNPFQSVNQSNPINEDAFLLKLDGTGRTLLYSTYLGGRGDDTGNSIAIDSNGNAYMVGETNSNDFPTANPLQNSNAGSFDAFIVKVSFSTLNA